MIASVLALLAVWLMMTSPAVWGEEIKKPSVSLEEVDALELSVSLEAVINQIDRHFKVESALSLRERKLQAVVAFHGWRATKQEIKLLAKVLENLTAIHELNVQKQEHADIEDIEVLRSHNQVIEKRIGLLQKQEQCRAHLFRLIELANLEIKSHESAEEGSAAARVD